MQRLLLIYNPHSSHYTYVKNEIIPRASKIEGVMVGKFAIKKVPFEENVQSLKEILENGDTVVALGGDATAAIAANAIIESGKDVTLGALPYGNFNDLAHTLGTRKYEDIERVIGGATKKATSVAKLYPLDIIVDGIHWRYATCYVTIGMTAESVEIFDEPRIRKLLQKGHKNSWLSYLQLAKWYFKNRRKKIFIPDFMVNGVPTTRKASDYIAVNGRFMCRVMKGGSDYLRSKVFRSTSAKLTSFPRLFKLMATSILVRTPGVETTGDLLEFQNPATIELQAEGEYRTFKDVRTIEIKKGNKYLKVIHTR